MSEVNSSGWRAAENRADGPVLRMSVSDTGAGIAPEQLPHVFSRFWQASDADRRGVGLGLSIARGIVESHGGTIWVESTPGIGTSFYFTVPTTDADSPAPGADAPAGPGAEGKDAPTATRISASTDPALTEGHPSVTTH